MAQTYNETVQCLTRQNVREEDFGFGAPCQDYHRNRALSAESTLPVVTWFYFYSSLVERQGQIIVHEWHIDGLFRLLHLFLFYTFFMLYQWIFNFVCECFIFREVAMNKIGCCQAAQRCTWEISRITPLKSRSTSSSRDVEISRGSLWGWTK